MTGEDENEDAEDDGDDDGEAAEVGESNGSVTVGKG